jgi:hypothetical protein
LTHAQYCDISITPINYEANSYAKRTRKKPDAKFPCHSAADRALRREIPLSPDLRILIQATDWPEIFAGERTYFEG